MLQRGIRCQEERAKRVQQNFYAPFRGWCGFLHIFLRVPASAGLSKSCCSIACWSRYAFCRSAWTSFVACSRRALFTALVGEIFPRIELVKIPKWALRFVNSTMSQNALFNQAVLFEESFYRQGSNCKFRNCSASSGESCRIGVGVVTTETGRL